MAASTLHDDTLGVTKWEMGLLVAMSPSAIWNSCWLYRGKEQRRSKERLSADYSRYQEGTSFVRALYIILFLGILPKHRYAMRASVVYLFKFYMEILCAFFL